MHEKKLCSLCLQEMLSLRGQHFGVGLEALASALASNIWPRPGLGQPLRRERPVPLITRRCDRCYV